MLKKRWLSLVAASCALVALGLVSVGQASAAVLQKTVGEINTPLLAIYGNPGTNAATLPVGGGLGRNFGFGENIEFSTTKAKFEVGKVVAESKEALIGGTLMSNKTGVNNPLSFTVQWADFQHSEVTGVGLVETYADTADRPWIAEICALEAGASCKPDPRVASGAEGECKIENVSLDLAPGFVVQGTVWCNWEQGKAKVAPCIKLKLPKAAVAIDTLWVTQSPGAPFPAVGSELEAIEGKFCVESANNDWYPTNEPEITLKNTA